MRVLIVGGGGREHALVARLAGDRDVGELLAAPGNPGIARIARIAAADASRPDAILDFVDRESIDFTIVGPELPLSLGIADRFDDAGKLLLGPSAGAARLESSKAFAKSFMARHGVPTARFRTCTTTDDAMTAFRSGELGLPVVLKADGLAAGKGVVIAEDLQSAERAIVSAMQERKFGAAGDRLVIEECLSGPEVSFFAPCRLERPRITNGSSMRIAGPIRAGWVRSRQAPWSTWRSRIGSCGRSFTRSSREWPRRAFRSAAFSTPA